MSTLTQARVEGRRRIYLARHADVSYFNTQGAALDTRAVPLNATGRAQATELSETFRENAPRSCYVVLPDSRCLLSPIS